MLVLADGVAAVCLAVAAVVPRPGIGVAAAVLIAALFVGWGSRGLRRGGMTFAAMALFQGCASATAARNRVEAALIAVHAQQT